MSEVQVRVKYVNGPGVAGAYLYGTVTGGSVKGESAGLLWGTPTVASHFSFLSSSLDPSYWKGNEEKLIVIQRTRGFAETSIAIKSSRNEPPVSLKFERADGILTLTYEGQRDVLRRHGSISRPNTNAVLREWWTRLSLWTSCCRRARPSLARSSAKCPTSTGAS